MESSGRAPGYDLFKSIVAIILFVLFFLLNGRMTPQAPTPVSTIATTPSTTLTTVPTSFGSAGPTEVPASSTSFSPTSTTALLPSPTPTNAGIATQSSSPVSTTLVASIPTVTPPALPPETSVSLSSQQAPLPSPTVTNVIEPTATPLPSPTATPVPSITSTPSPVIPVTSACDSASSRSRLQPGMNATILQRLNFRSSPGIGQNWLRTNAPGTKVEVIGGPECLPHFAGAYVWWQVRLPDGQIGWSAEASQFGLFYFMEPAR